MLTVLTLLFGTLVVFFVVVFKMYMRFRRANIQEIERLQQLSSERWDGLYGTVPVDYDGDVNFAVQAGLGFHKKSGKLVMQGTFSDDILQIAIPDNTAP